MNRHSFQTIAFLTIAEMSALSVIALLLSLGIAIGLLFLQALFVMSFDVRLEPPYYRGSRMGQRSPLRNAVWIAELGVMVAFVVFVVAVANRPLLNY
jgi:hypothetical protein